MSTWRDRLSRREQEKLDGPPALWLDEGGGGTLPVIVVLRGPLLPWQRGRLSALGLSLEGGRSAYGELSADQLVAAADWWWVARVEPQPLDALMAAPSLQSDSPAEELSAPATDSPAQRNEGN